MNASTTLSGIRSTYNYRQAVNISCTSTGLPLPTIRWTFNGSDEIPFNHTDISTDFVPRDTMGDFYQSPYLIISHGNATSILHVKNIRYPEDQGVYKCIGSNTGTSITATSSATFTIRVQSM